MGPFLFWTDLRLNHSRDVCSWSLGRTASAICCGLFEAANFAYAGSWLQGFHQSVRFAAFVLCLQEDLPTTLVVLWVSGFGHGLPAVIAIVLLPTGSGGGKSDGLRASWTHCPCGQSLVFGRYLAKRGRH